MRRIDFEAMAERLHMTPSTLWRKLQEENTSYRGLVDAPKMRVAIKYLRDTDLTVEHIAHVLGFSDAANFRHAFRRWTKSAPLDFKGASRGQKISVPTRLTQAS